MHRFYNIFTSGAGFFNQYVIPIGLANIQWRYGSSESPSKVLDTNLLVRFYIVGICWNTAVAIVIFFTYLETKGLTLEQIDKRFQGVPRDQIDNVVEEYNGNKPVSDTELDSKATVVEIRNV